MSQAWYTANTPVWFVLNVPGLVHCEYTGSVCFKCPRPGTLQIHWFGSFQMSQAWYTVNTPVWFFSSVPGQSTLGTPVGFIWSVPGVSPLLGGETPDWEGNPLEHAK